MEWISVNDRFPEIDENSAEEVIVSYINTVDGPSTICSAFYMGNFYLLATWSEEGTESDKINDITHWMPLPEPPK